VGDWIVLANFDERTLIIANAARLLKDAKLLADNDRYASAFALALLGLEEIGKVILDMWVEIGPVPAAKKWGSAHIQKQAAVASILMAAVAIEAVGDASVEEPIDQKLIDRVASAFHQSDDGKFMYLVSLGALDKTKQAALYRDLEFLAKDISHDQFDRDDVTHLFERAKAAIELVGDMRTMRTGRALFEFGDLPRPADKARSK
jgi:AbiV family abortive infection protein